jgi:hypothetical protein
MAMPVDSGEFFVFIVIAEQAGHKTKVSLARLQGAVRTETVLWHGQAGQPSEHSDNRFVALQYQVVVASEWVVIRCKRSDESWLSALHDFRRANGAGVVRVLLAGSMGLLPLTRVLLCTALKRRNSAGRDIHRRYGQHAVHRL